MRQSVLFMLATLVASCSSLEPKTGPLREVDAGVTPDSGAPISFAAQIRPLIARGNDDPTGHGCKECHYPGTGTQAGLFATMLDLSTLGALRRGGVDAPADQIIVPGHPESSALVQKLEGTYSLGARMPKDGPPYWSDDEIALVKQWITEGAQGTDDE